MVIPSLSLAEGVMLRFNIDTRYAESENAKGAKGVQRFHVAFQEGYKSSPKPFCTLDLEMLEILGPTLINLKSEHHSTTDNIPDDPAPFTCMNAGGSLQITTKNLFETCEYTIKHQLIGKTYTATGFAGACIVTESGEQQIFKFTPFEGFADYAVSGRLQLNGIKPAKEPRAGTQPN
jgi:hypothetical protein